MKTLVIIPTYNEKENIEYLINQLLKLSLNILIIDDNSPDGTAKTVEKLCPNNDRITLITRENKMGLSSAYIMGFNYALKHNFDFVITMDADLSHPIDKISELLVTDADFVIGSRYIKDGKITGWPLHRYILSKFANIYAKILLRAKINDYTSGFNKIKKSVLEKINFKKIKSEGYGFLIELKYHSFKNKFKLKEIPITFSERRRGKSKLGKKIIWEAFWLVLRLSLKT